MLTYPGPLPQGALVRNAPPKTKVPAAIWLTAGLGLRFSDAGRVISWQAQGTPFAAEAVAANATGTAYGKTPPALRFMAEENGGFVLCNAVADSAEVSLGMIFTPAPPGARTLLAVQGLGQDGYLFVSQDEAVLRLAYKRQEVQVPLPDSAAPVLLICTLAGGEVRMAVNGGPAARLKLAVDPGPADLFIGCRSPRGGLRNKLGRFDLSDVLVWPGQDVLAPQAEGLAVALALWAERSGHGV